MGWGNDYPNVLTYPFTKIAANGQGDMQKALGTSSMSQAAMLTGQAGYINPLALWKPFQSTTAIYASAAERRADIRRAYGGFKQANGLLPTYSVNGGSVGEIPSAPWAYQRPDGSTYPLRAMDLAPGNYGGLPVGYKSDAVAPIGIQWPTNWRSTNNQIIVTFNGAVPGWGQAFCLSIDDILPNDLGYGDYCFCLALSGSNGGRDLIVSTKRVRDVLSVSDGMAFTFSKAEVDALASLSAPNGYATAAICLYRPSDGAPSVQTIYHVPSQLNPIVVSLEIATNSDRRQISMGYDGSIAGLSVILSNLVLGTASPAPAWASSLYSCKQLSPYGSALGVSVNANGCSGWGQLGSSLSGTLEIYTEGAVLGSSTAIVGNTVSFPFVATVSPNNPYSGSFIFGNTFPGSQQAYALYAAKTIQSATQKVKAKLSFTVDQTISSTPIEVSF